MAAAATHAGRPVMMTEHGKRVAPVVPGTRIVRGPIATSIRLYFPRLCPCLPFLILFNCFGPYAVRVLMRPDCRHQGRSSLCVFRYRGEWRLLFCMEVEPSSRKGGGLELSRGTALVATADEYYFLRCSRCRLVWPFRLLATSSRSFQYVI